MSLSKQLGLGLFCVLMLMFVGTLWTNTANTRDFISQQLNSHAQDTATSLGLSVTPYMNNIDDLPIAETMINAIFDRGYYANIALTDLDNKVIVKLSNPTTIDTVPTWFIRLFDISAPSAYSELNDGWNLKGRLTVQSNLGFAYQQLWANAVSSFWLTLIVFLIAMLFVWLLVKHVITQPINNVIEQSEEINQQHFTQIADVPNTPELRKFVEAINYMSTKLSVLFSQLEEQSEKYRNFAYTDTLTRVGNRRAFQLYIEKTLSDEIERTSGHLLIIRSSSLGEVHKTLGGEIGDKYLQSICHTSEDATKQSFDSFSIYRISGADFAVVIENSQSSNIISLSNALSKRFKSMEKSEYKSGTAHIGITSFEYGDKLAIILARADSALSVATSNAQKWELSDNLKVAHSNEEWRDKIKNILKKGKSDFVAQTIVNKYDEVEYCEWFARVPNEQFGGSWPMSQLIPASIRLDYAQLLDQLIIENLLQKLQYSTHSVGINLSRLSIFDNNFMQWFVQKLSNENCHCQNLVIEIPERALVHDIESLIEQVNILKKLGIKIAVEHFGAQLAGIHHLRKVQPDYLKIDGRFTKNIHIETDNQLFIHSLINIAQGLNIKVIAEMVESKAEKDWLISANIDYLQGYFIASPETVGSQKKQIN